MASSRQWILLVTFLLSLEFQAQAMWAHSKTWLCCAFFYCPLNSRNINKESRWINGRATGPCKHTVETRVNIIFYKYFNSSPPHISWILKFKLRNEICHSNKQLTGLQMEIASMLNWNYLALIKSYVYFFLQPHIHRQIRFYPCNLLNSSSANLSRAFIYVLWFHICRCRVIIIASTSHGAQEKNSKKGEVTWYAAKQRARNQIGGVKNYILWELHGMCRDSILFCIITFNLNWCHVCCCYVCDVFKHVGAFQA